MKFRVLDLFSGIGGFTYGLELTGGFETVAFCEVEEYPRLVLKKHWPAVPIFKDIRTLTSEQLGSIDVICGGYPCQPFSLAGKRRGDQDHRHLWPEMFRLISSLRPAWVIAENVAGHIKMGLDDVLSDLEGEGYTSQPFVIPACAVDAPHKRDRLWIVSHADGRSGNSGADRTRRPARSNISGRSARAIMADAASGGAQSIGSRGHVGGLQSGLLQAGGHPHNWKAEPGVGRVVDGVPRRVDRIRALGNAVVPQIPEMIGHAILAAEADALSVSN